MFLECVDGNFLLQVTEEPTRSAMLDLVLTHKERLEVTVKLKGSLGCSDHEMVEFSITALVDKGRAIDIHVTGLVKSIWHCLT